MERSVSGTASRATSPALRGHRDVVRGRAPSCRTARLSSQAAVTARLRVWDAETGRRRDASSDAWTGWAASRSATTAGVSSAADTTAGYTCGTPKRRGPGGHSDAATRYPWHRHFERRPPARGGCRPEHRTSRRRRSRHSTGTAHRPRRTSCSRSRSPPTGCGSYPPAATIACCYGTSPPPSSPANCAATRASCSLSPGRPTAPGSPAAARSRPSTSGMRHSGELLHALRGHRAPGAECRFSPDSQRLVTGCYGRLIHIWEPRTGQLAPDAARPRGRRERAGIRSAGTLLRIREHRRSRAGLGCFRMDGQWKYRPSPQRTAARPRSNNHVNRMLPIAEWLPEQSARVIRCRRLPAAARPLPRGWPRQTGRVPRARLLGETRAELRRSGRRVLIVGLAPARTARIAPAACSPATAAATGSIGPCTGPVSRTARRPRAATTALS